MSLKYKIWVELKRVSPQAWCLEYLIAVASLFGIVLDHVPMNRVISLETMLAVLAVPNLALIPHDICMWIRGIGHDIGVKVISWIEEPLPFIPSFDPTPTNQFFKRVQQDN